MTIPTIPVPPSARRRHGDYREFGAQWCARTRQQAGVEQALRVSLAAVQRLGDRLGESASFIGQLETVVEPLGVVEGFQVGVGLLKELRNRVSRVSV